MKLKPLFEGDPLEASLRTIDENLSELRVALYVPLGTIGDDYVEALERATTVDDRELRTWIVRTAKERMAERKKALDAWEAANGVQKQVQKQVQRVRKDLDKV